MEGDLAPLVVVRALGDAAEAVGRIHGAAEPVGVQPLFSRCLGALVVGVGCRRQHVHRDAVKADGAADTRSKAVWDIPAWCVRSFSLVLEFPSCYQYTGIRANFQHMKRFRY